MHSVRVQSSPAVRRCGIGKVVVAPAERPEPGLPDFSWYVIPKPYKSTKCTQNVPNGHELSQMSLKYSKWPSNILTISNLRPYKIFPNWDFWFENKPSGNPGLNSVPDWTAAWFQSLPNVERKWRLCTRFAYYIGIIKQ
jgi:hypothetical protein